MEKLYHLSKKLSFRHELGYGETHWARLTGNWTWKRCPVILILKKKKKKGLKHMEQLYYQCYRLSVVGFKYIWNFQVNMEGIKV